MAEAPPAPAPRPLLRTTATDRYFDYCLQPYTPRCATAGKLRSENLLWQSLDAAGAPEALGDAARAIQRGCGRDMTVFGVKHMAGRIWWELYFYDPEKSDTTARASAVRESVRPFFTIDAELRESVPYFMFSFDLDAETPARGRVDALNAYLAYFEVQGGRSYKLRGTNVEFENVYRFLHPKREIREVMHELRASVFVDYARVQLSRVLVPELFACNRVCVAKKRTADSVYFSGIDVDQLLWFLRRFAYPDAIVRFVDGLRGELDHLLFDVGFDYVMAPDGSLQIIKSGYYGTL